MSRFELYCDGCGQWHGFASSDPAPSCPDCRSSRWLTDNEPNRSAGLAEFYGADYGGAFDGFTVTSDADPGL